MISEYKKTDTSKILYIINDASLRYKGTIPDDCWYEPYMSKQELIDEFNDGMDIYGGVIEGNTINSFGDHRIAMTALLASLVSNADIIVQDTVNIDTSFPEFIEIANSIGMDIKTYD